MDALRETVTRLTPGRAERVYILALGDIDRHFHFHVIPRYAADPPLGRYVLGASGWSSALTDPPEAFSDTEIGRWMTPSHQAGSRTHG